MPEKEKNTKEPTTTMRVPQSVDAYISSIATRERIPKATIMQRIIDKVIDAEDSDPMSKMLGLVEKGGEGMDGLKEIMILKALTGNQQAPQTNPMMEILMMKTLTAPDPMLLLMATQQNKGNDGDNRLIQQLLDQQKETQQVIRDTLLQRDMEANRQTAEIRFEEQQATTAQIAQTLAERLSTIETAVASVPASHRPQLSEEITNYMAIGEALKSFASKAGMGEKEIVSQDGSVDWNNIISRFFGMADSFIEKLPNERPAKKEVKGLDLDKGTTPAEPDLSTLRTNPATTPEPSHSSDEADETQTPGPSDAEMDNFETRIKSALTDVNKKELEEEGVSGGDE